MNRILTTLLLTAGLAAPLHADDPPAVNDAGLSLTPDLPLETVYLANDARLDEYRSVFIETPEVTFRKHWMRDQNRADSLKVRQRDVDRIAGDMSELMLEVMGKAFTEGGWTLAEAPGPGVLVVRPNIVDLDVIAPDIPRAQRVDSYSESAGSMTLDLELADGASGDLLLQATDHQRDPRRGWLEWRTRPYNNTVARRMMGYWARDMVETIQGHDRLAANG